MANVVIPKAFKMKIKDEANEVVGGAYNCYQDGNEEYLKGYEGQTLNDLIDDIYASVVSAFGGDSKKEIRFLGTKTIKLAILEYLKRDIEGGDIQELSEAYGFWTGTYAEAKMAIESPTEPTKKEDKKPVKKENKKPVKQSLDDLWAELKRLGGSCKVYEHEGIQRMRLVMAIKACK